jgi:hypothetical protein
VPAEKCETCGQPKPRSKSAIGKSADFERDVVVRAKHFGLSADDAQREGWKQVKGGSAAAGDVTIAGRKVECKHFGSIPNWCELLSAQARRRPAKLGAELRRYLKGHDALVLKQTGWAELVLVITQGDDRVYLLDDWLRWIAAGAPGG